MSGTVINFNDPTGGVSVASDTVSQAQVIAIQAISAAAQGIVTHEGLVNNGFVFSYNGATMTFNSFQQIIADIPLYTALNASSLAAASITWNN